MPEPHAPPRPQWLLLVHQLPARPSNLRVHIWRRLQQVGAVALRNSIYVLPNTAEAKEDFDWVRAEIAGRGGQVSVLAADAVDGYTDEELRRSFRDARTADYDSLIREVQAVAKRLARGGDRPSRTAVHRELTKARQRLQTIRAADFFGSPRAAQAQAVVDTLERTWAREPAGTTERKPLDPRAFRRRIWVTRPRPGIDRMASAWLIRRFIAPDARFAFASPPVRDGWIPFDMPDVEFGHHGNDCTFETLVHRFAIRDTAAVRIGQLVHDLDLKQSRYGVPEAGTIGRLVEGLRDGATRDDALLEDGIRMIEALYRAFVSGSGRGGRAKHNAKKRRRVAPAFS